MVSEVRCDDDSHAGTSRMTTSGRPTNERREVPPMLRNDLITMLSQHDNDPVTVDVKGILVDVGSVSTDRDTIVIGLDPDDLRSVLADMSRTSDPSRRDRRAH